MAIRKSKDRVASRFTQSGTQKSLDIGLEQDKDKDIGIIKRFLEKPSSPIDDISSHWVQFLERISLSDKGVLVVQFAGEPARVAIPVSMQPLIFESFHNSLLGGGHFSWRKTLHKASKKYFWPSMRPDFLKWTLECVKCQQKRNPHPSQREMQKVVVTSHKGSLFTNHIGIL
uniref:RNA-directed DNA polymerase n=1 Tax=Caenorhabditis japonica TaxID=281687 RepID=A0A8R1EQW4_CAEJA